ncbi:hypothetical protein GJR96_02520 [Haloferax sp. MBLA0076]|uniref:Serine protease n=1 Tax=Haloferax litoreum TaxID=2666140 RepID=A0A6A8GCH9_9EURY|nr:MULTISPECIES: hypothetical protein [Haloferax]KAB1192373.1 hypothetical protein Hfx1148_02505 [Haloferax sp. CBA1148]MRX20838.1 hypothetical protein [Haloferax litoreum]
MSMDATLQEIPEQQRTELESFPNVEATGIGPRVVDGVTTDEIAVVIFVREKVPESQLATSEVVPKEVEIEGKTYKTDVQNLGGEIRIQELQESQGSAEPTVVPVPKIPAEAEVHTEPEVEAIPDSLSRKEQWRPAPAGVSVGHPNITAGTLGTPPLVTQSGKRVFLTNAHVAAPIGESSTGDNILQPGKYDGGTESIGRLLEFSEITKGEANRTDSALVEVEPDVLQHDILGVWENLRGWRSAQFNRDHVKSGRTTNITTGRLRARNVTANVYGYFPNEPAKFEGLDLFTAMSAGGDSGSLIGIEESDGFYGTDLLFAGSNQVTLGIPMETVQDEHGRLEPMTSQDLVGPDDLRITGTHFTGTLSPKQTLYRWSGPWAERYVVDFDARPTTNGGWIESRVHSTYRSSAGVYYLLELRNRKNSATNFEVKYLLAR